MKALCYHGKEDVRIDNVPDPKIEDPRDVIISEASDCNGYNRHTSKQTQTHDETVAVGPDAADRILALDTMVINAIGLIVPLGIAQGTSIYFEVTLIIAMLGFVSTVAYARFILRGDIIE